MAGTLERLLMALTVFAAVGTLPVGLLVGLFVGVVPAAAVFVVGWLLVVPVAALLGGMLSSEGFGTAMDETVQGAMEGDGSSEHESRETGEVGDTDPLATLRERYASGEIGDAEFERRLERLVATEEIPAEAVSNPEDDGPERERGTDDASDEERGDTPRTEREPLREE